jgi:uncharacterized protein
MPLSLLVIQPTPFCNIDCDYCYLPARSDRSRMSMDTLGLAFRRVFESGLVDEELSVVWHAGEPLAVPPEYYREAFEIIERYRPEHLAVCHSFQTNATLLDEKWCAFIRETEINIGVSIDGPSRLHDAHRKTRGGRGTHAAVMRGIGLLNEHQIPFHVICLLTRDSLRYPDEILDFFAGAGIAHVGFNIEEIEGVNTSSSLDQKDIEIEFRAFFDRIIERLRDDCSGLRIREVDDVVAALRDPDFENASSNIQNEPYGIISISHTGEFGTFSPELLGLTSERYGAFTFGDVRCDSILNVASNARFRMVSDEIALGVRRCRDSCKYFDFCRGGAPANKLAETGSFASTETLFCRLTQKTIVDCVLRAVERDLAAEDHHRARPSNPALIGHP